MKGFPDIPPIWWLASMAVVYVGKWLFPTVHTSNLIFDFVSWFLIFLGLGVVLWSALWFWRKRTPIEPHHTPKMLIDEGPYRWSRNPIYLALIMFTLGSAIGHGSVIGLVAAAALWWVLDKRFAAPEEALLRKTFGSVAEDFFSRTRRWI